MRTELQRAHYALGGFHTTGWCVEASTDDAGPLLLLHGFGDNAGTWLPMLEERVLAGYPVTAVDLPGFGTGDDLDPDRPVLDQLDEFVAAAVTGLAVRHGRPVTVVGNSLGGALALRVAVRQPADVARVVAVAPAGAALSTWVSWVGASAALGWAAAIPLPARVLRTSMAAFYSLTVPGRPRWSGRQAARTFAAAYDRKHVSGAARTARRLLPELRTPVDLDGVRCPVLLVFAGRDRLVPLRAGDAMAAALPDAQHVVMPDAGHCVQAEEPAALAAMVAAFDRGERVAGGATEPVSDARGRPRAPATAGRRG
ncbi:alpha/beta hydrolase [Rhodococcus aerolatus]